MTNPIGAVVDRRNSDPNFVGGRSSVLALAAPSDVAMPNRRFLTVGDVGKLVNTSIQVLYRELESGLFPGIKVRGRWIIPARAVGALERASLAGRTTVVRQDWDVDWHDEPPFYTLPQAARLLGMSTKTLTRELTDGALPGARIRSRWLLPAKAIDAIERAALEGWTSVSAADWKVLSRPPEHTAAASIPERGRRDAVTS